MTIANRVEKAAIDVHSIGLL